MIQKQRNTRRICIYCPCAYALFDPNSKTRFGGAEVRAKCFAEGIARRDGFDVSFVVADEGQPNEQNFGGIQVLVEPRPRGPLLNRVETEFRESVGRSATFPWVVIRRLRMAMLWQTPLVIWNVLRRIILTPRRPRRPGLRTVPLFRDQRFDAVVCFAVHNFSANVINTCRRFGVQCHLFLANDHDLSIHYQERTSHIGPYHEHGELCYYALLNADGIIVQTQYQKQLLLERFGRSALVVRNPIDLSTRKNCEPLQSGRYVFWIGRAHQIKRPELCFRLAERCPDISFVMVVNRHDEEQFDKLVADVPENVKLLERLDFEQADNYIRNADVVLNTSSSEGFPNTFLQAAKYSVPIVSLAVDPDGFITRHECGFASQGDLERCAIELEKIWRDPEHRTALGQAGRAYVESHHELEARVDEFLQVVAFDRCNTSPDLLEI